MLARKSQKADLAAARREPPKSFFTQRKSMPDEPTATARFRAELTGAWAEFLASLFFVFFGAGSVCGAVKAVGDSP